MKILLTGATGYIGKRLLQSLVKEGHDVVCCVRDVDRFNPAPSLHSNITTIRVDFLDVDTLSHIPKDIDAAYYLIHSMSSSSDFTELEAESAWNFVTTMKNTNVKQVIYLSGMVNRDELSEHLQSRKNVENILSQGNYHLTVFRAGIIIGSGSASFEIIRDLVEKLPVMVAPRWLNTRCQPIGIRDVLQFLTKALHRQEVYDQSFDIGGPDILTYKEMLLQFAQFRDLQRKIYTLPLMTPRLSSYWLYFVTSVSYNLAVSLVDSMKIDVICRPSSINEILEVQPSGYRIMLERAFAKIKANDIISSWKDAQVSGVRSFDTSDFIEVPEHGCFIDQRREKFESRERTIRKIWSIGGKNGWYYADFLWAVRGFIDQLFGGVGLRRGRANPSELQAGDALDFWRVLYADKDEGRLLLFAEMKVPGEAWLEFNIEGDQVIQTATFRPQGVLGRLYWYAVWPFHGLVFNGMLKALASGD